VPGTLPALPTAATTGHRQPTTAEDPGDVVLDVAGALFEKHRVLGTLRIKANDVTVRDCELRGGPDGAVVIADGVTGTHLEDSTLGPTLAPGVVGDGFTALRLRLDTGPGFVGALDARIESSLFAPGTASNAPMASLEGGSRTVLLGNRCTSGNAVCVEAAPVRAPLLGLLVEGNAFETSALAVVVAGDHGELPAGTRLFRNRMAGTAGACPVRLDGHHLDGAAADCNLRTDGACCALP